MVFEFVLTVEFLLQDSHLQLNHAVEIIGKVQNDLSVRVMASTDFGPEGNIGELLRSLAFVSLKDNAGLVVKILVAFTPY